VKKLFKYIVSIWNYQYIIRDSAFFSFFMKDGDGIGMQEVFMNMAEGIKQRRTIRFFKQIQVKKQDLIKMVDAARLAPSAANRQQLRFRILQDSGIVERVFRETRWGGAVTPRRTPTWGKNAPLTFVVVLAPEKAGCHVYADAGAAIENMMLMAGSLGLGCCWIGSVQHENVKQILNLKEKTEVLYIVAMGYPDEAPVCEDVKKGESVVYYLDAKDQLHIPKLDIDAVIDDGV